MLFTGPEIIGELTRLMISHVVWIPDSVLGSWERDLESADNIRLIRVCREGEAWGVAAGLLLGGASPLVVMQTTGLFESGDALRNVAHDLLLPVYALIGARSWLAPESTDTARRFAEPILQAWEIDYAIIDSQAKRGAFAEHYQRCRAQQKPGIALLAE